MLALVGRLHDAKQHALDGEIYDEVVATIHSEDTVLRLRDEMGGRNDPALDQIN